MKFIKFNDYSRDVYIRPNSINGWVDAGGWVNIYTDDGMHWSLTRIGSENFKKIWKELDIETKG